VDHVQQRDNVLSLTEAGEEAVQTSPRHWVV